ncbi:hypothetical protein LTSEWAN_3462 [Salmonella enterica subsp. enterica serovar Wandsworth str. A4-580]|uniref:Uncharacterized protein n=1 Tax=Salmonella enterica subsp. enterica serovar Wandsworth str. A4-580 TaxID=913086 RepID=G5SDR3_SALET|nr:hypothetical protein LTSEHVI_2882 [Salmonella enterica subsp. enterica serovar Hvittingfoss str. A4-620]EHD01850.1 hypothetical protein LTSEWAN_3462 [Salmonella enterica subsp. enterica serovar Wandsworth str. A4-580]
MVRGIIPQLKHTILFLEAEYIKMKKSQRLFNVFAKQKSVLIFICNQQDF